MYANWIIQSLSLFCCRCALINLDIENWSINYHEILARTKIYVSKTHANYFDLTKFNSENHQQRETDSTCDNFSIATKFKLNKNFFDLSDKLSFDWKKIPLHFNHSHVCGGSQKLIETFQEQKNVSHSMRCSLELKWLIFGPLRHVSTSSSLWL